MIAMVRINEGCEHGGKTGKLIAFQKMPPTFLWYYLVLFPENPFVGLWHRPICMTFLGGEKPPFPKPQDIRRYNVHHPLNDAEPVVYEFCPLSVQSLRDEGFTVTPVEE